MKNAAWKPTAEGISSSHMHHFLQMINQRHQLSLENYQQLHQWSIQNFTLFWSALFDFCQVKASQTGSETYIPGKHIYDGRWFPQTKLNFAENLLRYRDEHTAIIAIQENGSTTQLSYCELNQQVSHIASHLTQLGVQPGDTVAAVLANTPEAIVAALATIRIGAIWSSCSPDFGIDNLLDRFRQITPKVLFTIDQYKYKNKIIDCRSKINTLLMDIPSIEHTIWVENNPANSTQGLSFKQLLNTPAPPVPYQQLPFNHPIYILFSSGTTGQPKCIVHSSGGTLLQHLKELKLHTNLTRDDHIFFYTSCGWMMWNWLISSLSLGATLILYDGCPFYPQPQRLLDLIDQHKITIFGVGAKIIECYAQQSLTPINSHSLKSLHTILTSASPLLPCSFDYIYQSIKTDVQVSSITGGTDLISCFALGNPMLPVYRGEIQCLGLGMDVKIYNKAGQSITNQQGELVCTTPFPCMPIGFLNDHANQKYQTAYFKQFPNTWTQGDYALINEHGGLVMYGRSDTTLNPGGIRIGTAEIYRQLEKIDAITDAIAIGEKTNHNEQITLFVVLKNDLKLDETLIKQIKTTLKQNASPHHVPAVIKQVPDLPRTLNGKLAELAVKKAVHGESIKNLSALANPEVMDYFR